MERLLVIVGWCLVAILAAWLRFDDLGRRPFHADEATGARITSSRMSGEGGEFDPKHYHGPLLGDLAVLVCRWKEKDGWQEMTKGTLRLLPAVSGLLVVLLPLFWRRSIGGPGSLAASLLLAVSPLLVYYSRMFIHEMLLVLAGGGVLASFAGKKPRYLVAGAFLGLMFAVKETFVISVISWALAFAAAMWVCGRWRSFQASWKWFRDHFRSLLTMVFAAAVVSMLWYTRLMTHPVGAWDALKTFFVYETVEGHDKPWWWYWVSFGWPVKEVQRWWMECAILWIALVGAIVSFFPARKWEQGRIWLCFLGVALLGHIAIYSVFGYKTPWLMCLPWMQACLLAGFVCSRISRKIWQWGMGCLVAGVLAFPLQRLARFSSGRLSSDGRNPYAYVPTRMSLERLDGFVDQLRPFSDQNTVAVIGSEYWPLPWYLRSFDRAGYWAEVPDGLETLPFVIVVPDSDGEVSERLGRSHTAEPLPRGLRHQVSFRFWIRNDIWKQWMQTE